METGPTGSAWLENLRLLLLWALPVLPERRLQTPILIKSLGLPDCRAETPRSPDARQLGLLEAHTREQSRNTRSGEELTNSVPGTIGRTGVRRQPPCHSPTTSNATPSFYDIPQHHVAWLPVSQTRRFTVRNVMVWAPQYRRAFALRIGQAACSEFGLPYRRLTAVVDTAHLHRVAFRWHSSNTRSANPSDQTSTADDWCDVTLAPFSAAIGPAPIYLT